MRTNAIIGIIAVVTVCTGCTRSDESFHRDDLAPKDLALVEHKTVGQNFFVRRKVEPYILQNGTLIETGGYEWVAVYGWDDATKAQYDQALGIVSIEDYLAGRERAPELPSAKSRSAPTLITRHEVIGLVQPIEVPAQAPALEATKSVDGSGGEPSTPRGAATP